MTLSEGRIVAVCIGPGGIPKRPVEQVYASAAGLHGDAHRYRGHGGPNRAVCLFSRDDYASLRRDGVVAEEPGAFGENLLIEGLSFEALGPGTRLAIGPKVRLEIHDIREPCRTLKSIDARFPALMEGRSGFVCRVLQEGELAPGQEVRVLA